MLHARGQSTTVLQQQHVDRLHRHTIHTTSAGMAHAIGPTARGNRCFYQLVVGTGATSGVELYFGDADTKPKRRRVLPQHRQTSYVYYVPVVLLLLLLPLFLSLSLSLCLCSRAPHTTISPFISLPALLFFRSYNEVFVQTALFIPYYLSTDRFRMCTMCQCLSFSPSVSVCFFVQGYLTQQHRHFSTCSFVFSQLQRSVCKNGIHSLLPFWNLLFFDL